MKKTIDGASYNTKTAKELCEQQTTEASHEKGADIQQTKKLFRTKSGKFFMHVINNFPAYVDVNDDDLNPKFELTDVQEEKIIPVTYESALQFASEVVTSNPDSMKGVEKYFPELIINKENEHKKIQKKIYISEKSSWYLEMMLLENKDTNSSFIEELIVDKYRELYKQGVMKNDPYFEMGDMNSND